MYNYIIFIVPLIHEVEPDNSYTYPLGFTYSDGKYAFVRCDNNYGFALTIAHELGHMLGALPDLYESENPNYGLYNDTVNLMGDGTSSTVLRKDQWDLVNRKTVARFGYQQ